MWKFFRPHVLPVSFAVLLCLAACSDTTTTTPRPKFNSGDPVSIGAEGVPGQVLEVIPQRFPYRYVVRYLPPPQSTGRDFRKDIFDEIELKPIPPEKGNPQPDQSK